MTERRWILTAAAVAIALVVIGSYVMFSGPAEHTLTVRSVPSDLTLTLDGRRIDANGDLKVDEGKHTLIGERPGFETYTQTVEVEQDSSIKVYLFSNSAEGRSREREHPGETLETEAEAGRRYDELDRRLQAKYPILRELPYIGPGFTINQGLSKAHPDDPERLAFYLEITDSEGRKNALEYLSGHGFDPADLELVDAS